MLDRLRGLLASEMPHQGEVGSHPPRRLPARPGAQEAGRAALWGPEHREAGRGRLCFQSLTFSMENFAPDSSLGYPGPRDTGKYQREWAKLNIQNFAHPGRGQSWSWWGEFGGGEVQALQTGSPCLFTGGAVDRAIWSQKQRVLRPALAQEAAAPEQLERSFTCQSSASGDYL